ncbi:hypothetical protein DL96DRAFT_1723973 [Flagelloscypha sp. PMI_526]|nr:hypothetical protein DL96DRAFT_1723973 [Flagelloscypha sp. PMI_526]
MGTARKIFIFILFFASIAIPTTLSLRAPALCLGGDYGPHVGLGQVVNQDKTSLKAGESDSSSFLYPWILALGHKVGGIVKVHTPEDASIVMPWKHQRHVHIDIYRPCSFLDDAIYCIWTYEEEILSIQARRESPSAIEPFPHCFNLASLRPSFPDCPHKSLPLELQ